MKRSVAVMALLLCFAVLHAQDGTDVMPKDSVEACYLSALELFSAGRYGDAVPMLRKAADNGSADAQYDYGLCFFNGNGVDENHAEAVTWFRKAAFQGLPEAQYTIGLCYEQGYGVEPSGEYAVEWYMLAAAQGYEIGRAHV